jgi:U4/U6 small nuclear ribonucleoprotein PRP3
MMATGGSSIPTNYPMMSFGAPSAPAAVPPVANYGAAPLAASSAPVDLAAAANAARDALEKAKKAAQFQKQIAEQMALLRGTIQRPRKLILDEFGRELDEEGNVVPMKPAVTATLAVNAKMEAEKQLKASQDTKRDVKTDKKDKPNNPYYDTRMRGQKAPMRKARPMQLMEEGALVKQEQKLVRKAQDKMLEDALKSKFNAKKEAFESRGKKKEEEKEKDDAPIFQLDKVKKLDPIPNVEWWDKMVCDAVENGTDFPFQLAERKISAFIEHPSAVKQALPDSEKKVEMHLTPAERKKFRKLRKQERTRDYQDKIKMGLTKPPPPKVKMSNLMRVLGDQAIADPSAIERKVRQEMKERSAAHEARNEANKLAPEERRAKKIDKWKNIKEHEGCTVLLFKVKSLSKRYVYKIDQNAQQHHMTGFCVVSPAGNFVIVEGNLKAARRYRRLMLRRIKWGEDDDEENEDDEDSENEDAVKKQECQLVWDGFVKTRIFSGWKVLNAKNEAEIRAALSPIKAEHYWDMIKKFRGLEQDL